MVDDFAGYATWYSWARANLVNDVIVCHAAATAAMCARSADDDPEAALEAARAAARDVAILAQTRAGYGPRHQYVEWFVWARDNLRLPDARCHEAARTALESICAGGSTARAAEAATRLMLPPVVSAPSAGRSVATVHRSALPVPTAAPVPRLTTTRILASQFRGEALWAILLGIASVAAPILTSFYFPVLPIAGLWRGVMALRAGRVAGGVVGIVLCVDGCLTSLVASGLLHR